MASIENWGAKNHLLTSLTNRFPRPLSFYLNTCNPLKRNSLFNPLTQRQLGDGGGLIESTR
jgi:hypothetical protein